MEFARDRAQHQVGLGARERSGHVLGRPGQLRTRRPRRHQRERRPRSFGAFGVPTGTPPSWLPGAIAERHPRLVAELNRDFADVDAELVGAIDIVIRGAKG